MQEQMEFDYDVDVVVDVNWRFEVGATAIRIDDKGESLGEVVIVSRHVSIVDGVAKEIEFVVADEGDTEVTLSIDSLRKEDDLKCLNCERFLDEDVDDIHCVDAGAMCCGCYEATFEDMSNVHVVVDGEVTRYMVTDYETIDTWGEPPDDLKITRTWHSSSGWRGYNETSIEGWVEVPGLNGWTTGFVDETVARKADLNTWVQRVLDGGLDEGEECPVPLAIILDPTSNVFSTAVGVWAQEDDVEAVKQWMADDYDMLSEALG